MRAHKNKGEDSPFFSGGENLPGVLSLSEASALIPGRPSISTVHRWISRGIDGHHLPSVKVGGRRMIVLSDLENFLLALNDKEPSDPEVVSDSSSLVSHLLGQKRNTGPCSN